MNSRDRSEHPIEAISAFIDGELRGDELERVEAHLAGCESCRKLADDLRRVASAVPMATRSEIPAGLEARVKSRLRGEPQASRRRRFVLPAAVAATLGALALLATVQLRQPKPSAEQVTQPSVAAPREKNGESSIGEVAAGKKADLDAEADSQPTDRDAGSNENKAVSLSDARARGDLAAQGGAAKDRLEKQSTPATAPAIAPTPEPPRDRQEYAPSPKEQPEREERQALEQHVPPPPPPAPSREVQDEYARRSTSADAKQKKKEAVAAEDAAGAAPGGVVGGIVGGTNDRPVSGFAPPCSSPWRAPINVSWDTASGDPQSVLAIVAKNHFGQVITGRDERGPFVSLLLPAEAWPRIVDNLRVLPGASVPPSPPPSLPPGTLCVRLDVRLFESRPED